MRFDEKGQGSAELILVTIVFIIIAGTLISLAGSEMDKADTGNIGQVRMIGESVAETINTVYAKGPGYSANVSLQNLSNSANYTISVYKNDTTGYLNVSYHNNNLTIKLIPSNITGSGAMNSGTTHQVTNNNGNIVVT